MATDPIAPTVFALAPDKNLFPKKTMAFYYETEQWMWELVLGLSSGALCALMLFAFLCLVQYIFFLFTIPFSPFFAILFDVPTFFFSTTTMKADDTK